MKYIRSILSKLLVAIVCVCISFSAIGAANNHTGDIGNYGSWSTEHNIGEFVRSLVGPNGDLIEMENSFRRQLARDYVPIEARLGIAMMNALTHVANILDTSLVRFMIIFIIVMYVFWLAFEAYNFMSKGDGKAVDFFMNIGKTGGMIIIWIVVLNIGPAKLFMSITGPIITIGTFLSDFILNSIAFVSGAILPDTCHAIHEYAMSNTPPNMLIDADAAANLMCLPTRLSGFFTSAIALGWKWMVNSVGYSGFGFIIGAIFTGIFLWNAWKFALMALGVVMDLFLAILLLPFTAVAETIPQTSYKGIAGDIFNEFIKLFNADQLKDQLKLKAQINRFINAAIYFVSLSIVISICAALLYGVITSDLAAQVPSLENDNFITVLLTGLLVTYLATKADEIAKDIGGKIEEKSWNNQFTNDLKTFGKDAKTNIASWVEAIKKSRG
ncbi:MAG: hypothetical protein J6W40_01530 [Alphaproteobacteria bacterium]|nr:hypothetical protein [Alphaproteobacteria bacterium]